MNYEMEELVPVVGKLAEKYTAYESTSITYEKAEQLMGAVLYCIGQAQGKKKDALAPKEKIPAQRMYEIGAEIVREKTGEALRLYNGMLPDFESYENRCLHETFAVGMPKFFRRYDRSFEPQNTILTLDYPVLKDITGLIGIDRIYEFLVCIRLEQEFLHGFPKNYVEEILKGYSRDYRDLIENLCEILLLTVTAHILAGKPMKELTLHEADCERIRKIFFEKDMEEIERYVKIKLEAFIQELWNGREELLDYLMGGVRDNLVRLKNGAVHGGLGLMVSAAALTDDDTALA